MPAPDVARARAEKVLLLEADASTRAALARDLGAEGLEVLECADAERALEGYVADDIDVVLVGSSSRSGGPEPFVAGLRQLPGGRRAACVLLIHPGAVTPSVEESGADDFLCLPATPAQLIERIRLAQRAVRLRARHEGLSSQLDLAQDGGWLGSFELVTGSDELCLSDHARAILGAPAPGDSSGLTTLLQRIAPEERAALQQWLASAAAGDPVPETRHTLLALDGHTLQVELRVRAQSRLAGGQTHLVGVIRSLGATESVPTLEDTDFAEGVLPGVLGRRGFLEQLGRCLQAAARSERHVAVLCIDLSQFKVLSGALTHAAGNHLLAQIVERLREGLRRDDQFGLPHNDSARTRIARMRSDELTLLLPEVRRGTDAVEVGRRVLQLLDEPFQGDGREVFVTVSIGVACSPSDGVQPEELLKHAETATLCARQQGRHTVLSYSPTMDARAFERLTLETGLRRAVERDELVVHYQPRVSIESGQLVGLEALVRWRHPDLGLVAPAQFISLAEETGLIVPIGAWVLNEACRQNRAWQEAGLPPVRMSVNISSVQFRQPDLYEVVLRALADARLEPRWLELELTESLLMQDPEEAVVLLERFTSRDIHLSIDDFGTGYSSLSYLRRFPIDSLKIDRSFIRELTTNPDDAAIATSIILMGKALRLNVVAEGVETRSQLSFLRVMKCQEAQGYLFSPPLPAVEVERVMRRGGSLLEQAA